MTVEMINRAFSNWIWLGLAVLTAPSAVRADESAAWFDGENCFLGQDKSRMGTRDLSQDELNRAVQAAARTKQPLNLACTRLYKLRIPEGADFSRANLQGARFEWTDVKGRSFDGAKMNGATFVQTDASGASFRNVSAYKAHFSGNFNQTTFDGSDLYFTRFGDCTLEDASVQDAFLVWSHFDRCKISKTAFGGSLFSSMDPNESEFPRTDLWDAYAKSRARRYVDPYRTEDIRDFLLHWGFRDAVTLSTRDCEELAKSHPVWNADRLQEIGKRNHAEALRSLRAAEDADPTDALRDLQQPNRPGQVGEVPVRANSGEIVKGLFDFFRFFEAAAQAGRVPARDAR